MIDSRNRSHCGEHAMNYLCLVYGEEQAMQAMDDRHCVAFDDEVRRSGHCIASEALQPAASATTVRVRNGKLSVTDGPFAETKEILAGFYMIEARDLNEAIQVASRIPPAAVGSIEIRPIRPIRETVHRRWERVWPGAQRATVPRPSAPRPASADGR